MVARADTPDFISTRLREEFSALCAPCLHSHPRPKIRRYHAFIWVRYGAIYGHTFGNFVAVFCWHCLRCWPPRALRWPCPGRSNTSSMVSIAICSRSWCCPSRSCSCTVFFVLAEYFSASCATRCSAESLNAPCAVLDRSEERRVGKEGRCRVREFG